MKEIRQIYIAQKKKDVQHHFMLVGLAVFLLGAVVAATEKLGLFEKK